MEKSMSLSKLKTIGFFFAYILEAKLSRKIYLLMNHRDFSTKTI